MFRKILYGLFASVLLLSTAAAQWQVPNNAVPYGKGPGKVGFGSATGSAGQCLIFGPPPSFGPCMTALPDSQIYVGNSSNIATPRTMTGSCSMSNTGVITCTSVGGIANASGSAQTTTGTITSGSASLAIASALDFVNGQGVLVNHAGAAFSGAIAQPSGITVTPTGGTGATTYAYRLHSANATGGYGIAPAATTIVNGVNVLHKGTTSDEYNAVAWTPGANATYTVVWRSKDGGAYGLCGIFESSVTSFGDITPCNMTVPFWLPSSPPAADAASWLDTTISSGGGTTTLTLAASAGTSATTQTVIHNDTAALNAALAASTSIAIPAGTYNITAITLPAGTRSVTCTPGATYIIGHAKATIAGQPAMFGGTALGDNFTVQNCSITVPQAMTSAVVSLVVDSTNYPKVLNNVLGGIMGVYSGANVKARISGNRVSNYWYWAIRDTAGLDTTITENLIEAPTPLNWGSGMGIVCETGNGCVVNSNTVLGNSIFGVLCATTNMIVSSNLFIGSIQEAIHGTDGCKQFSFVNNYITGQGISGDFGISLAPDSNTDGIEIGLIANNEIYNVGIPCIAVVSVNVQTVQFITVSGNNMLNCNATSSAPSANYTDIVVAGPNTSNVIVSGNTSISTHNNNHNQVQENSAGGGLPGNNIIGTNYGKGWAVAQYNLGGTGTVTPGATMASGTFAAMSTCNVQLRGATSVITDSNTAVWGANIAGGGANAVTAVCNGANWTVQGK